MLAFSVVSVASWPAPASRSTAMNSPLLSYGQGSFRNTSKAPLMPSSASPLSLSLPYPPPNHRCPPCNHPSPAARALNVRGPASLGEGVAALTSGMMVEVAAQCSHGQPVNAWRAAAQGAERPALGGTRVGPRVGAGGGARIGAAGAGAGAGAGRGAVELGQAQGEELLLGRERESTAGEEQPSRVSHGFKVEGFTRGDGSWSEERGGTPLGLKGGEEQSSPVSQELKAGSSKRGDDSWLPPPGLKRGEDLSRYSTWGIGGAADFLVHVQDAQGLADAIRFCLRSKTRYLVIGHGSNCLFDSRGFRGCVIVNRIAHKHTYDAAQLKASQEAESTRNVPMEACTSRESSSGDGNGAVGVGVGCSSDPFRQLEGMGGTPRQQQTLETAETVVTAKIAETADIDETAETAETDETAETTIRVGSGYPFNQLGVECSRDGLSGLEFASGIPGTVGGAVFMNAGAGGQETCDCLRSVEALVVDKTSGGVRLRRFHRRELSFAYRHSPFQEGGPLSGAVIVGATFALRPSAGARRRQQEYMDRRRRTQPLLTKSAGSVFRNPEATGGLAAGALIERAGLKGLKIGDAEVSEIHANFLVNAKSCSSDDMLRLIAEVKRTVYNTSDVLLQEEVRYISPHGLRSLGEKE